jgi:hypothetical protein
MKQSVPPTAVNIRLIQAYTIVAFM